MRVQKLLIKQQLTLGSFICNEVSAISQTTNVKQSSNHHITKQRGKKSKYHNGSLFPFKQT